ncbi:Thermostable beta-glucosidase B [Frondihabitans sp. 762G35]|uniref:beta-glucosidase family protein n=1 Tax=Frondihabitans sp. 762G35 TaxID=1446794 RepID=UPI000D21648B|nr:glycoside hydrolase family 3 C-terminal domain-containing protein [Frondihabitans sp. 762G35]ARC57737.1 Thermostable beta-glucosidase B [Frondihabitans sp. 762G35]
MDDDVTVTARLEELLARLTLEEKVLLLTGRDFWTTWPLESIGLRRMLVSDGPSGVRGEVWDERSPSLNLPSATALSSSWDLGVARRYGAASAVEARRKGVDVVLGPTINLHRSPLGGRHFEAFSEDPLLTAELAAAYVDGVQENGVGATPKHYIANDYETERFTASTEVSERALRELYLAAFEKAVVESRAWLVMSSYNRINGVTATENDLLETPLNDEWGFDGVVVSDWTAVRSLESAKASQDLVMPGPDGSWGDALVTAVREGDVPEEAVDRKVLRLLRLAARVGALDGFAPVASEPLDVEDGVAFAREAAAAGSVLLTNVDGTLPLAKENLHRVAVIGHNARNARTQGGGSATVLPERVVSPLDGIRAALPGAEVTWSLGAVVQEGIAELPLAETLNPATGEPGTLVRFLDEAGEELFREDRLSTQLVYFGGEAPVASARTLELSTRWTPTASGEVLVGFAAIGVGQIVVDGRVEHEEEAKPTGVPDLGAALLSPPSVVTPIDVEAGRAVDLAVRFDLSTSDSAKAGILGISMGVEADASNPDALIEEAVAAAAAADVAVVVVGTNSRVESEGFDRADLDLPGRQDDLVRAVVRANPNTVVVVNAGSPVLLPWRDDVRAVLVGYFGGQEFGSALADVLLGDVEPGGRLPTTWPATLADVPVLDVTPIDGVLRYDEGIHIGYRAWLRSGTRPAFEFGHGLGYTTWLVDSLEAPGSVAAGSDLLLRVSVTNTGERKGKQVVQAYLSRPDSVVDRPVRWLAAFGVVTVGAGATETVTLRIAPRAFAHWADGWQTEPGAYEVHVGTSVTSTPLGATVTVEG